METNASADAAVDARGPGCLRGDRPVRRCIAAAGSAVGWLPLAIAIHLLLLWIGHGAHHPE